MRLIVEGPKFSGKTTFMSELSKIYLGSTRIEVRCFFQRPMKIDPITNYYVPRNDTSKTLFHFSETFGTIPLRDDVIVERFHLFDWVQSCSYSGLSDWGKYEQIENSLEDQGFKIVAFLPPLPILIDRAMAVKTQEVHIPHSLIELHRQLYLDAIKLTRLPTLPIHEKDIPTKDITTWLNG